jgi:hypothetical protein
VIAPKGAIERGKAPAVAGVVIPTHAPLMIAQADRAAAPAAPRSLIAKTIDTTLDIKDHVVGATLHVVSAIGSIPSWIASIAGGDADAAGQDFSSDS